MKTLCSVALTAILSIAGATVAQAGDTEVVVTGTPATTPPNRDTLAVSVCAEALVRKLMPNSDPRLRIRIPNGEKIYFVDGILMVDLAGVGLKATDAKSGKLLATGSCRVDGLARVISLSTEIKNPSLLAGLRPRDIRFTVGAR